MMLFSFGAVCSRYSRALLWPALLLLTPLIPFLLWGERIEPWITDQVNSLHGVALGVAGFAVLAADILLPVPSSVVGTLLGARLGIVAATLIIWAGQLVGSLLGFVVARHLGRPWLERMVDAADRERLQAWAETRAATLLVVTRALPLLAEAAVLLVGTTRVLWQQIIPALALSHLGIAVLYAVLGHWGKSQNLLAWSLAASLVLPVLATILTRLWLKANSKSRTVNNDGEMRR